MEFRGRFLREPYLYTSSGLFATPEECIYLPLDAYSQPPVSYGEGSGLTGLGTDEEVKKATDEVKKEPATEMEIGNEIVADHEDEEMSDEKTAELVDKIKRAKKEAAEQPLKVTSYLAGQEVTGFPLQGKGTVMKRLSKESPALGRKNKKTKFEARLQFD
jgi:hypothetical protein